MLCTTAQLLQSISQLCSNTNTEPLGTTGTRFMNEQIPLFATKKERKNIQEKDTNTAKKEQIT